MADKFNTECLHWHNEFRKKHDCPPLTYSEKLARTAQDWAEEMAKSNKLGHSQPVDQIGENVADREVRHCVDEFTGKQATCMWYSEVADYVFGKENQLNCGHFSQMVWKATKEAGFGRAMSKEGLAFVVGHYNPMGNFRNRWAENVPKPVSGEIEVPTEEDQMGPQTPRMKAGKSGAAGDGDGEDELVSKRTKSRTSGGVKTVTVIETYQRPNGTTYEKTTETTQGKTTHKIEELGGNQADREREPETSKKIAEFSVSQADGEEDREPKQQTTRSEPASTQHQFPDVPMLGTDTGDFRKDVLDAHNAYRRLHGCHDLRSNRKLDQTAQQWADRLAATNTFKHSTSRHNGTRLGENIACKFGSGVRQCQGREAVHQWYARNFSQVISMDSEELGVGYAVSSSGKHITVCHYYPAGKPSMNGKFPPKVQPPPRAQRRN